MQDQNKDNWYRIDNIDQVDTPALAVYPARVKENIGTLVAAVDDVARLRPHVKTHKTTEATLLMLEAGIRKFKCATIAEAEMLAMAGAPDILFAYQPGGPKLQRLIALIKKYPDSKFSCLVDNMVSAENIAAAAVSNQLSVPVYIDLNIGMNRTGIAPGDEAIALYKKCATLKGIQPVGLHAYDGHLHEKDFIERTVACNNAFEPVEQMQQALVSRGFDQPVIVAGGSPTFPIHAKRKMIECSPGTFVFWDRGYSVLLEEQDFIPAALVLTRVISLPDKTKICLDLGHKSIAAENELQRRVWFINAPEVKFISHSEEHLVVEAAAGHRYKVGDVLYGMPIHICPTCALYERALTIENNIAGGEWKIIARDRKINI